MSVGRRIGESLLFGVYAIVVVGGLLLSLLYAVIPVWHRNSTGISALVFILVVLVFLHFAEGAELAVTTMLDRDHDQIAASLQKRVDGVRRRLDDFVAGRQFLVTVAALTLPFLCGDLESDAVSVAAQYSDTMPNWLWQIVTFDQPKSYAYWFPVFSIFFFSQLYSKYIVQKRPQTFFANPATGLVINISSWVGRAVRFGLPDWLVDWAVRRTSDPEPGPSRLQMYRAQAAFRDGVGQERVDVVLEIDPNDGSVHYTQTATLRAYAHGNQGVTQEEEWTAPILPQPEPTLHVPNPPGRSQWVGNDGPELSPDRKSVCWRLAFPNPLDIDDSCDIVADYHLAPHTMNCSALESDTFEYRLRRYPVKLLTVSVKLKSSTTKTFANAMIDVSNVSDDPRMNAKESLRVRDQHTTEVTVDRLYFEVRYPLLPAVYTFKWNIINKLE